MENGLDATAGRFGLRIGWLRMLTYLPVRSASQTTLTSPKRLLATRRSRLQSIQSSYYGPRRSFFAILTKQGDFWTPEPRTQKPRNQNRHPPSKQELATEFSFSALRGWVLTSDCRTERRSVSLIREHSKAIVARAKPTAVAMNENYFFLSSSSTTV